ncbi:hypothetical protein SSP24_22870 [Streptomyces spinoverrucosus]|uniref:Uncharacterized protein n=1 Tax=Streptomyces spinoverrucosus TaxID=284043 RepID=A0A4Y3VBU7_9ACTN|nr:hypothetical protein SSP24_22870 [Streptomyces spinoverrucosus]GHB58538.1 hypothetical protein GCM10010397_31120 [Streptomyces spinoverrucosus]
MVSGGGGGAIGGWCGADGGAPVKPGGGGTGAEPCGTGGGPWWWGPGPGWCAAGDQPAAGSCPGWRGGGSGDPTACCIRCHSVSYRQLALAAGANPTRYRTVPSPTAVW